MCYLREGREASSDQVASEGFGEGSDGHWDQLSSRLAAASEMELDVDELGTGSCQEVRWVRGI